MEQVEAVVVGAGNGGLTAALGLARAGVDTLLLERHNVPGGCATSFVRGRFEFEVALHQLSGLGTEGFPGPLRDMLTRAGVVDRIDFVQMANLYRLVIPDQLYITLAADRQAATDALKKRFPDASPSLDRFFDLLYDYCMQWVSVVIMRDPEATPDKYPVFFSYALKSTQEVLDAFFEDEVLKTTLGVYWAYLGLPPSRLPFGDFAVVLWAYLEFKPWHIRGGSQALSNTLLAAYLEAGGKVRFNCGVDRILTADGRVAGVVTDDGARIETGRVISNASTHATYVDLMAPDQVPASRMRELGARTLGTSFTTVYIGFDRSPEELGIDASTTFIATGTDADHAFRAAKTLAPSEAMLFSCYDVEDSTFSPPGTCQAALVAMAYAEPWLSVPPAQYADTKYRIAGGMLETLYRVFPRCRDHIEELDVATPLTHMRYLGHPGGAVYGFDQYAKDNDFFLDRSSPIDGLYHVGAWAGMGGFQPTLMSGYSTARKVAGSLKQNQG